MPDTDRLHGPIRHYDSFSTLLDDVNSKRHTHEMLTGVEGVGTEIEENLPAELTHLSPMEIGWMWLLYEAHHDDEESEKAEVGGVA